MLQSMSNRRYASIAAVILSVSGIVVYTRLQYGGQGSGGRRCYCSFDALARAVGTRKIPLLMHLEPIMLANRQLLAFSVGVQLECKSHDRLPQP